MKPKNTQRDLHFYALAPWRTEILVEAIKADQLGDIKRFNSQVRLAIDLMKFLCRQHCLRIIGFLKNYSRPNPLDMIILNSSLSQHPSLAFCIKRSVDGVTMLRHDAICKLQT